MGTVLLRAAVHQGSGEESAISFVECLYDRFELSASETLHNLTNGWPISENLHLSPFSVPHARHAISEATTSQRWQQIRTRQNASATTPCTRSTLAWSASKKPNPNRKHRATNFAPTRPAVPAQDRRAPLPGDYCGPGPPVSHPVTLIVTPAGPPWPPRESGDDIGLASLPAPRCLKGQVRRTAPASRTHWRCLGGSAAALPARGMCQAPAGAHAGDPVLKGAIHS